MCVAPLSLFSLGHPGDRQGTVREPVEFYQKVEGNAGAWGKAVATIDASAVRVFADRWALRSAARATIDCPQRLPLP